MLFFLFAALCFSQTYEQQVQCMSDLTSCQAQVTSIVDAYTQEEPVASPGELTTCDPADVIALSAWWQDKTSNIDADLFICDADIPYWAIKMADGSYRSMCIAFSDALEDPCPSDEIYCSLNLDGVDVYGYAGNVVEALEQALQMVTKVHPWCPKGSCSPLNGWMLEQMELEGISSDDAAKLCLYGDSAIDQYYYVQDENTILNTCVVEGTVWDMICVADAGRVCSAISGGQNVIGWPRQQAKMVYQALLTENNSHPQCEVE